MNSNRFLAVLTATTITLWAPAGLVAQDEPQEINLAAPSDNSAGKAAQEDRQKAAENEPPVSPYEAISKLIQERQFDQAARQLESAIEDDPNDSQLHYLRDRIGQSYLAAKVRAIV